MKKLLVLLILIPFHSFSQEINGSSISIVYNVEGVDAKELFSRLNYAVANIFNSANDVIQMSDENSNKMVVKALTEIAVKNNNKIIYPKNKYIPEVIVYNHNYTLNIAARDGRYRLELRYLTGKRYVDPAPSLGIMGGYVDLDFPPLMDYSQEDINETKNYFVKKFMDKNYNLISRKKKQILIDNVPAVLDNYQNILKGQAISIFERIHKEVQEASVNNDDW